MKRKIKLFDPIIGISEEKEIIKVLKSGFWASGSGSGNVQRFENEFKKYVKSKSCIAVNSGTAALNLALSLFDIKNKEVILPSTSEYPSGKTQPKKDPVVVSESCSTISSPLAALRGFIVE